MMSRVNTVNNAEKQKPILVKKRNPESNVTQKISEMGSCCTGCTQGLF